MNDFLQVLDLAWLSSLFSVASTTMSSWPGHFITCLHRSGALYRGKRVIQLGARACASMFYFVKRHEAVDDKYAL